MKRSAYKFLQLLLTLIIALSFFATQLAVADAAASTLNYWEDDIGSTWLHAENYEDGDLVTLSYDPPPRHGFNFMCWRDSAYNYYYNGDSFTMPSGDFDLIAVWEPLGFVVEYDDNGGSGGPGNEYYYFGDFISVSLTEPTLSGYIFHYWLCNGTSYHPGDAYGYLAENLTFVAQWQKLCHVYYNANGGSGAPVDPYDYLAGDSVTVLSDIPTNPGFVFAGWLYATTIYFAGDTFIIPEVDAVLVAQWLPEAATEYTVTINNSYSLSSGAGTYTSGSTITIDAGVRPGYQFSGWTIDSLNVTLARLDDAVTTFIMPDGEVTLTANWQVLDNPYTGDSSIFAYLLAGAIACLSMVIAKRKNQSLGSE